MIFRARRRHRQQMAPTFAPARPLHGVGSDPMQESPFTVAPDFADLEQYRSQLTAYCYRMLGSSFDASPFDAQGALQDALVPARRNLDPFQGRAPLRRWLYRIAPNVCLDMLK